MLKRLLLLGLMLVVAALMLASAPVISAQDAPGEEPSRAMCEGGAWFDSEQTGRIWLVNFEETLGCQWGRPEDVAALQRSGRCGLPWQRNHFQVLTHNWKCTRLDCPVGKGWVSNIPLLELGDPVELCEFGNLYTGVVIENLVVTDSDPQPQSEFDCEGVYCGTIVTSTGERRSEWGPTGQFTLVRISYE